LGAIDGRLAAIKSTHKGDLRESDLQFYTELAREIRAFNYAWRDPVMHTRLRFDDPHEAENVFTHIKRYMERLATKVHEEPSADLINPQSRADYYEI
jgi:hypothetical protein